MSEPTPLSAHFQPLTLEEERRYFRWCDEQRDYIGRVTAWRKFDAQATEIAALKGALESIEDAWAKLVEPGWQKHVASLKGADAPEASHAWVKHIFTFQLAGFRARVLAGKEAQSE